ncbi:MAG: thioredoxin family protein [Bacteroidia bacterium]|nr:thioredoxin family protein [Bacteroidia bacterium]
MTLPASAQVQFFTGTWTEALALAQKKKQPIFVDFYTTWCGPCKMMSKTTFQDVEVGKFANSNFIAVKIDAEKGNGIQLADQYKIEAYPTIVFLSPTGEEIGREVGFQPANDFLGYLKQYAEKYHSPNASPSPLIQTEPGIQFFKGSWADLLAQAKKTNKPFFVDFYTTWCGPCKMMSKSTFTNEEVGKFTTTNFLAYKIDAEKGEGVGLAQKYQIQAYPTIIFYDASGNEIGREIGYQDAAMFLKTLQKYTGKSSSGGNKPNKTTQPKSSIEDYFKLKEQVMASLEPKISGTLSEQTQKAFNYGIVRNDFDYEDYRADFIKTNGETNAWLLDAYYQLGAKDYDKLIEIVNAALEQKKVSADQLHWFAWKAYQGDKMTADQLRWINFALRTQPDYSKWDTKAAIQFSLGKFEDALESAKQAKKEAQGNQTETTNILLSLLTNKK